MLTPSQQKWIDSLSDRKITIYPYDDRSERLFSEVKKEIQDILGNHVVVEHCGASNFKISGQDEIDVSIVVPKEKFDLYIPKLENVFGPVQSSYEDRARFEVKREGKKIDLKIIDINHPHYIEGKTFEDYLKSHPEDLGRYRILKEEANGQTVKEYYQKKVEFINEISEKARNRNLQ